MSVRASVTISKSMRHSLFHKQVTRGAADSVGGRLGFSSPTPLRVVIPTLEALGGIKTALSQAYTKGQFFSTRPEHVAKGLSFTYLYTGVESVTHVAASLLLLRPLSMCPNLHPHSFAALPSPSVYFCSVLLPPHPCSFHLWPCYCPVIPVPLAPWWGWRGTIPRCRTVFPFFLVSVPLSTTRLTAYHPPARP